MRHLDPVALGLAALVTALLTWAAVSDVRARRIPNLVVVGVLALMAPWVYATGLGLASALAAGLIALAATFALFAAGVLGAGDAKLFSSLAVGAGLAQLPALAVATTLIGGALACGYILARPRHALVAIQLRGRARLGGIPYGVAIAVAGAIVLWSRAIAA